MVGMISIRGILLPLRFFLGIALLPLSTSAGNAAQSCSIQFSSTLGTSMVLQRAPAAAAVYGTLDSLAPPQAVVVTVSDAANNSYSIEANLTLVEGQPSKFKALLRPTPAGGSYTIAAECIIAGIGSNITINDTSERDRNSTITSNNTRDRRDTDTDGDGDGNGRVEINDVTFGDVWYCAGQSNMALSLKYTTMRNVSEAAVRRGMYGNVRIHGMKGNMNPRQEWMKAIDAVLAGSFLDYSSTCWYFGETLTNELSRLNEEGTVPPIGLVHTGWGGTMIEDWLDLDTVSGCKETCAEPNGFHETRVVPYVDMSIKGWVWYQGENNMYWENSCILGNPLRRSGYSCLQVALVKSWREQWSRTPGTTDALAPFGLVALPNSGKLGGMSIGTMRWAQTGGYGVLPNPSMPATFLVQAYDQDDPYSSLFQTCWTGGCCFPEMLVDRGGDPKACEEQDNPKLPCDQCSERCAGFCSNLSATHAWMGPIHPRTKHGIGARLGKAAARSVYGDSEGAATGPTLAGCVVEDAIANNFTSSSIIRLLFNDSLLGNDSVRIQDYDRSRPALSKLEVLIEPSVFCLQLLWRDDNGWKLVCVDDGDGNSPEREYSQQQINNAWVPVDIVESFEGSGREIIVDLSKTDGIAHAVRYVWQGDCCDGGPPVGDLSLDHCPLESCPIMGQPSGFPANPFLAKIVDGKCRCVAPQECNEVPGAWEEEDQARHYFARRLKKN